MRKSIKFLLMKLGVSCIIMICLLSMGIGFIKANATPNSEDFQSYTATNAYPSDFNPRSFGNWIYTTVDLDGNQDTSYNNIWINNDSPYIDGDNTNVLAFQSYDATAYALSAKSNNGAFKLNSLVIQSIYADNGVGYKIVGYLAGLPMISQDMGSLGSSTTVNLTSAAWGNIDEYRIFNIDGAGIEQVSFGFAIDDISVSAPVPTATTGTASSITSNGATLGGTINDNGANTTVTFEYGTSTSYGSSVNATPSIVTAGAGSTAVSATISGLLPNTTYHYRVKGVNSTGTTYGSDSTFATSSAAPGAPTIGTATAGNGQATVSFSAPASNGGAAITGYTVTSNPGNITATGVGSPLVVTGLTNGTSYTFTVTATNSVGTGAASATSNSVTPATVVTASSNGIATATGTTTITLDQAISDLAANDIVVKKDGVPLTSATDYTLGALTGTTLDITFTSSATLNNTSVVTVEMTKAGYTINSGNPIVVANTIPAPVAPTVTGISPSSGSTTGGTSVTITGTNLTGATGVKFGSTNISSFTIDSATQITATAPAGTGTVDVTVTTAGGTSATSSADQFTYVSAPSITGQPGNQTVTAGNTVSFSVSVTGDAPLSYQWKKDGSNISGETSATLSIANAQASDAGSYTVVVTNGAGSATSNAATLTVNPAPVAPSITTQPTSQTVTVGQSVSLSVSVAGDTPLSYQWKKDGSNISGETSSTLSIASAQASDAGSYTVVVTNGVGSATSSAATLTVNPAPVAPSITTQPTSQTVTVGQSVSLSVSATGDTSLSYQWKKDGSNISGETSATLSIASAQASDAGSYTVVVTNGSGNATSNAAILTVIPVPTTYTLTYTAGANGTISGTTVQTVTSGGSGTKVTAVANAGYHFVSWSDGLTSESRTDSNVMGNVNVTANFAADTSTNSVSYDGNGNTEGTVPVDSSNYNEGDTVTVLDNSGSLDKTGYAFDGWNTEDDGSGTNYSEGDTFNMGSSSITLYAKWKEDEDSNSDPITGIPTGIEIDGTLKVGNTLTAELIDTNGSSVTTSAAVTYTWYRLSSSDSDDDEEIGNDETYKLVSDDGGKYIKVVAEFDDEKFEYVTSKISKRSSGSSSSSSSNHGSSTTQAIKAEVTNGSSSNSISQIIVERTTNKDGTKADTVDYTESKAKDTVEQLLKEGQSVARIVLPDSGGQVSETNINISKGATSALSAGNVSLEMNTENGIIALPTQTLQGLSEDVYFRLVPIKDAAKKQEIQTNANREAVIKVVSGSNSAQVLGNPTAIETNISGQEVNITLPLKDINIPTDSSARDAFLKDLGIYIEHSDGTTEFVKGEIVEYSSGIYGIKFTVTKFSNFTIVKLNQPTATAGTWQNTTEGWKYINNGVPVTGWNQVGSYWYLMNSAGTMETGWKQVDDLWYFLKSDGVMATGWQEVNGEWYYLNSNGSMASNTVIDGYTLGANGAWIK